MTRRERILRTLEACAPLCLDNAYERDVVAGAVAEALKLDPDAQLIRSAFANAPTTGTRLIVMREIGGAREGHVLDAAARLAGCEGSEAR